MSIKFFGQFLLERGAINSEQLLDAIRYQEARNMKFGQYAFDKGFLSQADVDLLHEKQKNTDLRIGELAVQLKLMSHEQVEQLLMMQRNDHVCIGESLVKNGAIDQGRLNEMLDAFREDQRAYAPDDISVPDGLRHPAAIRDIVDISVKIMRRMAAIEVKPDYARITREEPAESFSAVSITFSGSISCEYILTAPREASIRMASAVMGEDVSGEADEIIIDGVKEFANIVCGNVLARFAQKGLNVQISIPHLATPVGGKYALVLGRPAIIYTLVTTSGDISLAVIEY